MLCTKALYSTPELSYVLGYYTKLLVPEGSNSQCQPGGAESRTWGLSDGSSPSSRRGCQTGIVTENK
jgi:hypothetical protein